MLPLWCMYLFACCLFSLVASVRSTGLNYCDMYSFIGALVHCKYGPASGSLYDLASWKWTKAISTVLIMYLEVPGFEFSPVKCSLVSAFTTSFPSLPPYLVQITKPDIFQSRRRSNYRRNLISCYLVYLLFYIQSLKADGLYLDVH